MPIKTKTAEEITRLREGGRRLAHLLETVADACEPNTPVPKLDQVAKREIAAEDSAAFFNYQPSGAARAFPARVCISINDEIVHGIPTEGDRVLQSGDVVTVDAGLKHKNLITDSAMTFIVGGESQADEDTLKLLRTCKHALDAGIKQAKAGNKTGDISAAIEEAVGKKYAIFRELVGHGVGFSVHEPPQVPNYGESGTGTKLKAGTVIAIEPMIGLGENDIEIAEDNWTYKTADGTLSAHFEHTVAVTEQGPQILTKT